MVIYKDQIEVIRCVDVRSGVPRLSRSRAARAASGGGRQRGCGRPSVGARPAQWAGPSAVADVVVIGSWLICGPITDSALRPPVRRTRCHQVGW